MRGRSSVVLAMLLIAALFCLTGCGKDEVQSKVDNRMTVQAVTVAEGSIYKEVTYSGSLKGADEVTLYPKVAARVTAIHLRAGDRVRAGQAIISLDTTDYQTGVTAAEATVTQAETNYQNTKDNVERTRQLYQQGAVSLQQMEQAELGLVQAETMLQQARASLQNARNLLNNCRITSPINGVVGLIQVTEGNMASPQVPVAVVSSTGKMSIKVTVNESDIRFVTLNSPVKVKVKSLDDKVFDGKVSSVAAVADPLTKGFPVEIVIDNPDNLLRSGMLAEVRLSTEKRDGVITVPRAAVIEKGARKVVFTVDKKSVVHETTIETGLENRERVEVTKGLSQGDKVIIKGQTLLNDKDEVRLAGGQS